MITNKIIEITKKLEDLGYKLFNKTSIDVLYVYYHNQDELIDIKFDYLNDEWELLNTSKPKIKTKNDEVYSFSKVLATRSLKTDDFHSSLIVNHKSLPKIISE